jgi:hypothetical protein
MHNLRKCFTVLLAFTLAFSSLIIFELAYAQGAPNSSVPEFTVNYVENSYDIVPT